jgi:hypothetical protein
MLASTSRKASEKHAKDERAVMAFNFLDHKFLHWYHVNGRDSALKSVSSWFLPRREEREISQSRDQRRVIKPRGRKKERKRINK